eukprot:TRINITY_DN79_c0_g1_i19.p1 TRINITY_DN79_c0_g1~~TRINITY_DN79_c0_g1_i19.p1  ORF type:complete len:629 (+),score=206.49 TRINITY_DN79_c0_g1_i19:941-2827(+)
MKRELENKSASDKKQSASKLEAKEAELKKLSDKMTSFEKKLSASESNNKSLQKKQEEAAVNLEILQKTREGENQKSAKEKKQLSDDLTKFKSEASSLTTQNNDLSEKLKSEKETTAKRLAEIRDLKSRIENLERENAALEKSCDQAKMSQVMIQGKLNAFDEKKKVEIDDLQSQLNKALEEIDQLSENNLIGKDAQAKTSGKYCDLQKQTEKLEDDLRAMKKERDAAKQQLASHQSGLEISELTDKLSDLEKEQEMIIQENDDLVADLQKKIDDLTSQLDDARGDLYAAEGELDDLKRETEPQDTTPVKESHKTKTEDPSLSDQLKQSEKTIEELTNDLNASTADNIGLEKKLSDTKKQLSKTTDVITDLRKQVTHLNSELDLVTENNKKEQQQHTKLVSDFQTLEAERADLAARVENRDTHSDKITAASKETIKKQLQEIEDLKRKHNEEVEKYTHRHQTEILRIGTEVSAEGKENTIVESLRQMNETLTVEKHSAVGENARLTHRVQKLDVENEELRATLSNLKVQITERETAVARLTRNNSAYRKILDTKAAIQHRQYDESRAMGAQITIATKKAETMNVTNPGRLSIGSRASYGSRTSIGSRQSYSGILSVEKKRRKVEDEPEI